LDVEHVATRRADDAINASGAIRMADKFVRAIFMLDFVQKMPSLTKDQYAACSLATIYFITTNLPV
jgi:hypothetical protein